MQIIERAQKVEQCGAVQKVFRHDLVGGQAVYFQSQVRETDFQTLQLNSNSGWHAIDA